MYSGIAMPKKKNKSPSDGDNKSASIPRSIPAPAEASKPKVKTPQPQAQPSTSSLIICRNKHWRYISSFHGPWLQLPPEVLESLANNNYTLPRPRPIDPAVFFDLLKVRQLVEEATTLAVRAASGVTSSSLNNSLNANNNLLGNAGAALGLGGGGGGNAKLSPERKHRMREQATQKLSKAYHFDEIACSVATMQSASTLEDVAQLVLRRNPDDPDAKYVHFFHEKIPSRQLAECTSLQSLDEIVEARPYEGEILRTRAVTKIFKEDYVGAAQDLTLALQVCRYYHNKHKEGRQQIQLASEAAAEAQRNNVRWKEETKFDEEDHPRSLETQILFHRAGVYLTIAHQHINSALPSKAASYGRKADNGKVPASDATEAPAETAAQKEARHKRMDARKIVKTNAKRALRDYVAYLSQFDYTPGLSAEVTTEFIRKVNSVANSFKIPGHKATGKPLDLESNDSLSNGSLSDALVQRPDRSSRSVPITARSSDLPSLPAPTVYQISALFSATPPPGLPPYPETQTALSTKAQLESQQPPVNNYLGNDYHEALTYHPLLTDALHSLLLCHCLVQTSKAELLRHAHMVARLARVCDGYPIFQAARSPSRADWIEVVRRGENWIGLNSTWETLCAPAPLPGQSPSNAQKETATEKEDRLKQQAIMEALEDDRVHDEASFHAAVAARQRRQREDEVNMNGNKEKAKRWAQDDGKEYPISTERAAAIVRWVREAPVGGEGKKKKRSAKPAAAKTSVEDLSASLSTVTECLDQVEEEVE
ncbi:hypothetical protein BJ878DRAFT_490159 [Calycina marina]|uniref:Histidine kinase group protein n=1 Tax=Calycina marina TaxID=1763456 RepID=A0A9P7Z9K0_9HELO|nr:hypothetical protein BJ878DRAFT_490159 [Calycina marina]